MGTTYTGVRTCDGCAILKDGQPLDLYLGILNHSPTGFEWAYSGSGPAQTAIALCCDVLGVPSATRAWGSLSEKEIAAVNRSPAVTRALSVYHGVKRRLVANLPRDGWELDGDRLLREIEAVENEMKAPSAA